MRLQSLFRRALLCLLLLLSQQQALLHGLSHGLRDRPPAEHAGLVHKATCVQCLGLAPLDHFVHSRVPALPAIDSVQVASQRPRCMQAACVPFIPYQSRAPPAAA